jgi:hypothetical protein
LAGALFTLLIISVSISYFAKGRNKGKPKVEVPVYDKCFDCGGIGTKLFWVDSYGVDIVKERV